MSSLAVVHEAFHTDLMAYTRSSRDDFDRYANVSGDQGWSWDAIEPYFRKVCSLDAWYMLCFPTHVLS